MLSMLLRLYIVNEVKSYTLSQYLDRPMLHGISETLDSDHCIILNQVSPILYNVAEGVTVEDYSCFFCLCVEVSNALPL